MWLNRSIFIFVVPLYDYISYYKYSTGNECSIVYYTSYRIIILFYYLMLSATVEQFGLDLRHLFWTTYPVSHIRIHLFLDTNIILRSESVWRPSSYSRFSLVIRLFSSFSNRTRRGFSPKVAYTIRCIRIWCRRKIDKTSFKRRHIIHLIIRNKRARSVRWLTFTIRCNFGSFRVIASKHSKQINHNNNYNIYDRII